MLITFLQFARIAEAVDMLNMVCGQLPRTSSGLKRHCQANAGKTTCGKSPRLNGTWRRPQSGIVRRRNVLLFPKAILQVTKPSFAFHTLT